MSLVISIISDLCIDTIFFWNNLMIRNTCNYFKLASLSLTYSLANYKINHSQSTRQRLTRLDGMLSMYFISP